MKEIQTIKLKDTDSFQNHPFQVNNDASLLELADSIKRNGLLNPIIVRKKSNNKFELISGHRRKLALELNKIETVSAYVEDMTDDEATICMVDSNIYR